MDLHSTWFLLLGTLLGLGLSVFKNENCDGPS